MAIKASPRSVSDATRFTAATPHASSKPFDPRFSSPSKTGTPVTKPAPAGGSNGSSFVETPEQRVARLRAAHRAAQAQASTFDKIIGRSRRVFDSAHKIFVMGIIGFTGVAFIATAYTAADMMSYNKKRKAEFIEAQRRMEEDSLEAARLAYMLGKATEEQVALVEEALERETAADGPTGGVFNRLPSALGPPKPIDSGVERVTEAVKWPASTPTHQDGDAAEKKSGLWAWMTSSLKKEEEGDDVMSTQRRLGYESLSEEDDGTGVRDSDLVRAVESKQAYIREKAHEAFEKEKENQRTGGPLDRVGLGEEEKPKKKGWLW